MALIIVGVVVGVAVLVVILAAILMLVLAAHDDDGVDESKLETRITMQAIGVVDDDAMATSKIIVEKRLGALGIEGYRLTAHSDRIFVDLPGVEDIEQVKQVIGATTQLQFRQVLDILAAGDEAYDTTPVTGIDPSDKQAYQALPDKEIVLEKEEKGKVYKVRLGPTRLTGDVIETAEAQTDKNSGSGYLINFTLTDKATRQFGALTEELQSQTSPMNQLAIVVDYIIESHPAVNEPITDGKGEITGDFDKQEAEDLALALKLGALPVDFVVSSPEPIK